MIALALATPAEARWAHTQVVEHHYLHRPVDARCSVLTYLVTLHGEPVGCLMFGRPESTACYQGACTYGSLADVERGRAHYSRWELLNLARVWLDPAIQRGGRWFVPNAATRAIGMATKRVVYDYLAHFHPVTLDAPWELRQIISYCDTRVHHGGLYRAAGFTLARTNAQGIQTWMRAARPLRSHERARIATLVAQSARSRFYRAQAAAAGWVQTTLDGG